MQSFSSVYLSMIWCMLARTWLFCLGFHYSRSWRDDSWTFCCFYLCILLNQENVVRYKKKNHISRLTFCLQKLLLRKIFQVDFFSSTKKKYFHGIFFLFRNIFFFLFVEMLKINIFIGGRLSYKWNMIWTISKLSRREENHLRANTSRANFVGGNYFVILRFSRALQLRNVCAHERRVESTVS